MATYRTRLMSTLPKGTVVSVQTDMTFYQVAEMDGEITVHGPGVEETYFVGTDVNSDLSTEAKALAAVLLWEDQI